MKFSFSATARLFAPIVTVFFAKTAGASRFASLRNGIGAVVVVLATAGTMLAQGSYTATMKTLHHFSAPNPLSGLVEGADGNYYGTTTGEDTINGAGTVFRVTSAGVFSTLRHLTYGDGFSVQAGLSPGKNGVLYGAAAGGGERNCGTLFQVRTDDGNFTVLHVFDGIAGSAPLAPPILGADGALYGTASGGGANGFGTIYRDGADGAFSTLHSFNNTDGAAPRAALLASSDGGFYGTTAAGGANGQGTVFRIGAGGTFTQLHSFDGTDGSQPYAALIQGADGAFYGTTLGGGSNHAGTVFRITSAGALTTLHAFNAGTELGGVKGALCLAADGNFYGTGPSAVFRLSPAGVFTIIYTYSAPDTLHPAAGLIQGTDGNFYGTTAAESTLYGGTVFQLTPAGHLTVLMDFDRNNGTYPIGPLLRASAGTFYGVTYTGGPTDHGTIYRATAAGAFTSLHAFNGTDGNRPFGAPTLARDGTISGSTLSGGANNLGTIFHLTSDGTLTSMHNFAGTDGSAPIGQLVETSTAGDFFGVTETGGTNGVGTVYIVNTAGSINTLQSFTTANGANPEGGLLVGSDGNLYGTGFTAGTGRFGTIFRTHQLGFSDLVHSFTAAEGAGPQGKLAQDADGNFYGATESGGPFDEGTIFQCLANGTLQAIHYFGAMNGGVDLDGHNPAGNFILASDGFYYGTCPTGGPYGGGTIYRFKPSGSFSVVYAFNPAEIGGSTPGSGLVQDSDGTFYGVTSTAPSADGTVFSFTLCPAVTSTNQVKGTVNQMFSFQVAATNNADSYSAAGLPEGLTIEPGSGLISGLPKATGVYAITLTVSNSTYGASTSSLTIRIVDPVLAISGNLNPPSRQGVAFAYQIVASNHPFSYATLGLPAGLGLSTSTGKISGTPTRAGTYSVKLSATNSGGTGTATLNLVVKPAVPAITSSLTANGRVGGTFNYQITATNSPTKYGESGLPGGLTINQANGKITGKPTAAGTFSVTIAAFNSAGSGSAKLTLTIKEPSPVITSALTATATVGKPFSYRITAANHPTKYGEAGLPGGLVIDQTTGQISGAPTKAGTYTVTIAAFNSAGSGSAKLTLMVKPSA